MIMLPPTPEPSILKKIKSYDKELFIEWDIHYERWALKRKGSDGRTHHVFFVQNKDGSYRQLDERLMYEIYECDIWRHFDNPGDYHKFLQEHNKKVELDHKKLRREFLNWWNKEHKKEWAAAIEDSRSRSGRVQLPTEKETKLYSFQME